MMEQFKVITPAYAEVLGEALKLMPGYSEQICLNAYILIQAVTETQHSNEQIRKEARGRKNIARELNYLFRYRVN